MLRRLHATLRLRQVQRRHWLGVDLRVRVRGNEVVVLDDVYVEDGYPVRGLQNRAAPIRVRFLDGAKTGYRVVRRVGDEERHTFRCGNPLQRDGQRGLSHVDVDCDVTGAAYSTKPC